MNRKKPRLYMLLLLITGSYATAIAQDTVRTLALNEALEQTLQRNRQLTGSKLDEQLARYAYRSTAAYFLPQVNFSYAALSTNNPLNAFGFKLQQQRIGPNDFDPKRLNDPSAATDFMTQLQVQQPLLNIDMLYMRKTLLKQTEALAYKTNRMKDYLQFEVKNAYLQLQLLYETKKVLETSLVSFKELYRFTKDRYDQGLVQRSDLLNTEVLVRAAETRIAETASGIRNVSDQLSLLMGVRPGPVYEIPVAANEAFRFNNSLSNDRADFLSVESAIAAVDYNIKSNRAGMLPRINAFGNYQLHDRTAFGFEGNGWFAGVQLSWDLFRGNTVRNKIASLEVEKNKLNEELLKQKDEAQSAFGKALRQYRDAGFTVSQQTLAVTAAEEAFRVLRNRYNQGLVNTTDVLMAQTQVSNQQLVLAQAVFAQQLAAASLQFITSSN